MSEEALEPGDRVESRVRTIDFSSYSLAQLRDFQVTLDRANFPEIYQDLLAELARREFSSEPSVSGQSCDPRADITYTSRQGFMGWLQAKRLRSRLYGRGSVQVGDQEIAFRGWEKTWLGVAIESEVRVAYGDIRRLTSDGHAVVVDCTRDGIRSRRFVFQTGSAAESVAVVAAIRARCPDDRWSGWDEISAFNQRSRLLTPHTWVTYALVGLNILLFFASEFYRGYAGADGPMALVPWGANYGPATIGGQWWRLLTSTFLHFGMWHLAVNMWVLWSSGRLAEKVYGSGPFLYIYIYCGVCASLASIVWNPLVNSVGASGAIFGVLGALLAFLIRSRHTTPRRIIRAHLPATLIFVVFNLIAGFAQSNVDNAAHVGGLASGVLLGWVLARRAGAERFEALTLRQISTAIATCALVLGSGLWLSGIFGEQVSGVDRYMQAHSWYSSGETGSFQALAQIQRDMQAGTVSNIRLKERLQREVLEFWQGAGARLRKETLPKDREQRRFAELLLKFVDTRVVWARSLIDSAASPDDRELGEKSGAQSKEADRLAAQLQRLALRSRMDNRHRPLSDSPLVRSLRSAFDWTPWKCVGPMGADLSSAPKAAPATDGIKGRAAAGCAAQSAFMKGDYKALDALINQALPSQGDLADGSFRLSGVAAGLSDLFKYTGEWDQFLTRIADWRHEWPESVASELVEVMVYEEGAWAARGHGYANAVTQVQWASFFRQLEMAAAGLTDLETRAAANPLWHQLRLSVGSSQELSAFELRDRFDLAVQRFPNYLPYYRTMLHSMMPRWGGTYAQMDRLISDAYRQAPPSRGWEVYARLYSLVPDLEGEDFDLFSTTRADWPAMRHGFKDLLARYPTSLWLQNRFAYFACMANDAEQYHALRAQLQTQLWRKAWQGRFTAEQCDRSLGRN